MLIMTGAPMPDGADTVVRVEDTDNASDVVTIAAATPKGMSTRQAGEDLRKGERVLEAGTPPLAAQTRPPASAGDARVPVCKPPPGPAFSACGDLLYLANLVHLASIR